MLSESNLSAVQAAKANAPTPVWENIPEELRSRPQWVLWRYQWCKKSKSVTKVPCGADGRVMSATDPSNWLTYEQAASAYLDEGFDGVGFSLATGGGIVGTDIDDASLADARPLLVNTYTESSPSGKGFRQIALGAKPEGLGCQKNLPVKGVKKFEVYEEDRYLTVTGMRVEGYPADVKYVNGPLTRLCETYLSPTNNTASEVSLEGWDPIKTDDEVLDAMLNSASAETIGKLLNGDHGLHGGDHSAADMALLNHLAFWTAKNPQQMDSIFRESCLMRDKWDNKHRSDGTTYGEMTMQKAIEGTKDVWALNQPRSEAAEDFSEPLPGGFSLTSFSLRGSSAEMEAKMLDDTYILQGIALSGQSTSIYAKSNTGKTLLTFRLVTEAIESGELDGENVFYVNADDNHKGLTQKLKLAEQYGLHMLAPGYNGFRSEDLDKYLKSLVDQDSAHGKILILDTVKKFVDLMDKKKGTDFGTSVREFVSHGGSVIMLAHVNKHRDQDGKVIFAGTSDLVDDADCAYTLDELEHDPFTGERTVIFENFKSRGDVAQQALYRYDASTGMSYEERLETVTAVDDAELSRLKQIADGKALLERNRDEVDAIKSCLADGITQQQQLIKAAVERSGSGQNKIRKVLKNHTGTDQLLAQFWTVEVGENNAHRYKLAPIPALTETMGGGGCKSHQTHKTENGGAGE